MFAAHVNSINYESITLIFITWMTLSDAIKLANLSLPYLERMYARTLEARRPVRRESAEMERLELGTARSHEYLGTGMVVYVSISSLI